MLLKAMETGQDLHITYLVFRNTSIGRSISRLLQILANHLSRTILPLSNNANQAQLQIEVEVLFRRDKNQLT